MESGGFCRGLSRSVEVCRAILSSSLSSSCRVSCRVVEARAQGSRAACPGGYLEDPAFQDATEVILGGRQDSSPQEPPEDLTRTADTHGRTSALLYRKQRDRLGRERPKGEEHATSYRNMRYPGNLFRYTKLDTKQSSAALALSKSKETGTRVWRGRRWRCTLT